MNEDCCAYSIMTSLEGWRCCRSESLIFFLITMQVFLDMLFFFFFFSRVLMELLVIISGTWKITCLFLMCIDRGLDRESVLWGCDVQWRKWALLKLKWGIWEGVWCVIGGLGFKISKELLILCRSTKFWDWNKRPSALLLLLNSASLRCHICGSILWILFFFGAAVSVKLKDAREVWGLVIWAFSWAEGNRSMDSSCKQ